MDPRTFWDDKFKHARYAYGTAPNAYLEAHAGLFPPGEPVLSVGEGEGRNAVYVAGLGYQVTAIDASPEGLKKLRALAFERGVGVEAVEADVRAFDLGDSRWGGLYNVYCHLTPEDREALYARIRRALRPGGVFLTEQFSTEQLAFTSGGPKDVRLLLQVDELTRAFAGFEVLEAAQARVVLDEGPLHQGPASVIRFLARKP